MLYINIYINGGSEVSPDIKLNRGLPIKIMLNHARRHFGNAKSLYYSRI